MLEGMCFGLPLIEFGQPAFCSPFNFCFYPFSRWYLSTSARMTGLRSLELIHLSLVRTAQPSSLFVEHCFPLSPRCSGPCTCFSCHRFFPVNTCFSRCPPACHRLVVVLHSFGSLTDDDGIELNAVFSERPDSWRSWFPTHSPFSPRVIPPAFLESRRIREDHFPPSSCGML